MPRKKRETVLERTLSEIADSLIAFLTDESESGQEKVATAIKLAGKVYKGEGFHWLYSYWRTRKEVANHTERDVEQSSSIIPRLQALAKVFLDPDSAWKSTSYNTTLLYYFLGALDDNKKPIQDPFFNNIIDKLADPFKRKLQDSLHEHLIAQKIADEKKLELEIISTKAKKESLGFVKLFASPKDARGYASNNPQHISFSLFPEKEQWFLVWYDAFGDDYSLEVSEALSKYLSSLDEKDIYEDDDVRFECIKLRDAFIEKRKLLINPPVSALSDLKSAFVLKGKKENYELYWYDEQGDAREIDLESHPALSKYLNAQDTVDEKNIPQLNAFLRKLNTGVTISINKARQTLEKFFRHQQIESINSFKLLVNPATHALANLMSTFIVYKDKADIKLEWYDTLGNGREINLEPYPGLSSWLSRCENIAEEDYPELKQQLLEVDTSQPINRDEFKRQLEDCLLKRRQQNVDKEKNLDVETSVSKLKDSVPFDLGDFQKKLTACFNTKMTEVKKEGKVEPSSARKLDLSQFAAVTGLFGHKDKDKSSGKDSVHEHEGPLTDNLHGK